jgi:hypothetical protein
MWISDPAPILRNTRRRQWLLWSLALAIVVVPAFLLWFVSVRGICFYGQRSQLNRGETAYLYLPCIIAATAVIWPASRFIARPVKSKNALLLSKSILLAGLGGIAALLSAVLLGLLTIGAAYPAERLSKQQSVVIFDRAADLWGEPIKDRDRMEVYRIAGFGTQMYGYVPPEWGLNGQDFVDPNLYQEFGWPFRCMRSPVPPNFPRKWSYLFNWHVSGEHQFVRNQFVNLRLLPVGFTLNTIILALLTVGSLKLPRTIRWVIYARTGRCVECGYILKGLTHCPECGHTINV